MKKLLVAATLMCCIQVAQADVAVVVNANNSSDLDTATVSRMFLNKIKQFPNGVKVESFALSEGSALTQEFNAKVLKKTNEQLSAFWARLIFTGKGQPPEVVTSDEEMLAKVASTPGAIGYVDASSVNDTVRVIATF